MTPPAALTIRPLQQGDAAHWRMLWRGYLDYYETTLPEAQYDLTFARMVAGAPDEFRGMIALLDGRPVGLVHFLFHPSTWRVAPVCYLQDLFTLPEARGTGVARALIDAVYRAADAGGAPDVYWFTQDFNATARRLYDRIGVLTPFIRYNRPRPFVPAATQPGPGVVIRPLRAGDAAAWRALWEGYLAFYGMALPGDVTATTFARLTAADPGAMRGLIAEVDGEPAGLAHLVAHRSCWSDAKVCCLQDLYVAPQARGRGAGQALIEAVYAAADADGTPAVYWTTQDFNATARRIYDRIGTQTPFLQYDRPA